ncbi:MAG: 23S rRNA (cytidine1920-2'-O)/16S rRNA (cytidine1409-2'-O)-methyltransferase [Candidatus Electronema aureum]|uniref:23S rRNA (Cytidine1920-2'-O)/16S rRNA (Cytidine1409-2'-O)-methyltransferase n=1 Tax=Candidatus Electronema aureum TaxID=2005002 RepID=A0A521G3J7_9BACT|nr:MAG: 23S rRNA (cytidine1920-2'-O)/16S rRNA (cytidine1409-2'-O)-methyltransferase [Candidatus Electronema aureum]
MPAKKRLDLLLTERGIAADSAKAAALIGAGRVLVGTRSDCKAGSLIAVDSEIKLKKSAAYVSRSGEKLAGGLRDFALNPSGWICADIGCSTGGFTDCLLQHGAARVYSVDVGYGLLAWKLRQNQRVTVLERTNARHLNKEQIPEALDLAVIDASFISLQLLMPPLLPLFGRDGARILALVKPQFELPKDKVGTGGIVREQHLHEEVLAGIRQFAASIGFVCVGSVAADICGAGGNQEFLLYFKSAP